MLTESLLRLIDAAGPLLALVGGTLVGLLFGLTPGLSGRIGLLIALPWVLDLDPFVAATFLVALHAVVHTSGSLPAILFGIPTSAAESATVVDGFPMMRANRGGEAIGATIAASAFGGILGAIALMLLVPVIMPLVALIGTPEVAMLSLVGLASISSLSGPNPVAGFIVAACGVLVSLIGVNAMTGAPRFTFGLLELWDGLNVAAVIAGIFVIPEMLARAAGISGADTRKTELHHVLAGCAAALRHTYLMVRSSIIGIVVGFMPGIGASVAVWLAYGQATQTVKPAVPFGQGAIEGVIAPEAANNSKEGGSLAPTLFFGIPGSSGMAILMAAFISMGIDVGPRLIQTDPGFVLSLGWIILLANLLAVPICLGLAPGLVRLARFRQVEAMPIALALATVSVFAISPGVVTLIELAVFGAIGTLFALAGWPRAPFVLGFVIGPIFESALARTASIWGLSAMWRPGVLVLAALAAVVIFAGRRARRPGKAPAGRNELQLPILLAAAGAILFAATGTYAALQLPFSAAVAPVTAAGIGAAAAGVFLVKTLTTNEGIAREAIPTLDLRALALYLACLAAAAVAGISIAVGVFVGGSLYWIAQQSVRLSASIGIVVALAAAAATGELPLPPL
jgi:TctA family transporter